MTPGMPPLSEQDIEVLSSYLDGELAATARAELEARLAVEPALRAALESLQATVALLKATPRLTPPRNFTLDPAKYRRAVPWWARYRAIQFAGALGTIASLILIAVGLLTVTATGSRPTSNSAAQSIAKDAVAVLTTSTLSALPRDQGQSAPGISAKVEATVTAVPTQTLMATSVTALESDAAAAFAATMVPTATSIPATNPPPVLDQQNGGAIAPAQPPQALATQPPPPAPSNNLAGSANSDVLSNASPSLTPTATKTMTAIITETATTTPTASPSALPSTTNAQKALAPALVVDEKQAVPSPLPLFLLAVGISLLVFSVMLIAIGWMRSRLKED